MVKTILIWTIFGIGLAALLVLLLAIAGAILGTLGMDVHFRW
jgi:hypothetical protein